MYTFTVDWFSIHIPKWMRHFAGLAGRPDLRFVEVGCFEGRATVWLLENVLTHPTCRIDCIDTFRGSAEHRSMALDIQGVEARFDHNVHRSGAGFKVAKRKGTSAECLRLLPLNAYDFAYVDGSHLARDVLQDAVLCFGLLKSGGLMIFDDYNWDKLRGDPQHPRAGVDAFLKVHEDVVRVVEIGYQAVVRKV